MGGASPPRSWASTRAPHYPTFSHFATQPKTDAPFATSIAAVRLASVNPPDDANDLRGYYFRQLLGKLGVRVAGRPGRDRRCRRRPLLVGPAIGAAGLAAALLVALLIVFGIADSRAEGAFFDVYAAAARHERLRPQPPAAGNAAAAQGRRPLRGAAAGRTAGRRRRRRPRSLHLRGRDDRQRGQPADQLLPLHGRPRRGAGVRAASSPSSTASASPACARWRSSRTSSAAPKSGSSWRARRSTSATRSSPPRAQDANHLRQLFSPTFIVWLTDSAPEKFAFELVDGTLCCYVKGHKKKAAELDTIRAASATVATRLREESLE